MNLNRFLFRLKQSPSTHTICSTMASSQISSKAGRCRQTAKTRLLWFREAGNVKKGWELMGVHMLLSDAKVLFNFLIHWLVFNNYFSFAQQRSRKSLGCWLRSLPNPLKQILERFAIWWLFYVCVWIWVLDILDQISEISHIFSFLLLSSISTKLEKHS